MADEQIVTNIVATSNFSNLITDVQRTTVALAKLQAQLVLSNKNLAVQAGQIQKSFGETLRSTDQFTSHFVTVSSGVETFGKNLDAGRLKLKDYFKVYQDHNKSSGGMIRELSAQQVTLQNALVQTLGKTSDGLMKFNVHVAKGLDEAANKSALARKEMQIYNKVIQDGGNQIINWGKNTQWAGRQLTVGLTVPIAAFGKAAADAFLKADQELVRLTKVYGGLTATSSKELAKVRADVSATAATLAKAYGASYKDTISLAADIAATGKTGQDLIKSTTETTRLAILGEVDRQDAMKATLAIQNAFKQNTTQLTESINFLNAVENQTSTSLADLIEAIPKAGPVIQGMGGSIKDLALYLTAMKEGGVNAAEGANALKSALASLINPTKVAKDMMSGFGIDLSGIVTKNAGNLTGTILELQSALDSLNPLQKQQALEQLFGKFQFARMNALFANLGKQGSQTLQVLDLMKASSQDLANVAGRELAQVTESASGKYRRALEGLKADLAGVGEQFLKVSTFFINMIDGVVKFSNSLPGPIKTLLSLVAGITAIAGPLIMLTGVFANFFGYIIKGIGHFRALFKGAGGFKLLTPEILAAQQAGNLIEKTFYSDAKAAEILQIALKNLINEFTILEQKASSGAISVAPALSTMQGNLIAAGMNRVVDPNHPLLSKMGSRASAHMNPVALMSEQEKAAQTIFGMAPAPGPVNLKIGANPQMYMESDLPKISGVTSIKGVSTGVVAEEAAKWHAMTGALAMQSEAEIKLLKREVAATGTITTELSTSYQALLPKMTELTSLAASESMLIVEQLQAGKITVDIARSKIMALNAEIEIMMGQAATGVATAQGRTLNLQQVPLLNQPVVSPAGKSNMKELFHKGNTADLINNIARNLGVRTSGGGYSIETTIPKRFNTGGSIETFGPNKTQVSGPSSIKHDDRMGSIPLGGYVLNQKASLDPANKSLVDAAPSTFNGGGNIPALLTPKETIFGAGIRNNPELYDAVKAANNGMNLGGRITARKNRYGNLLLPPASNGPLNLQRTHITDDLSGLALLLPRWLNMGVNANGDGLTGMQIIAGIEQTLNAGYDPNGLMNQATTVLGGDISQAQKINRAALDQLMTVLKRPENIDRIIGGKSNRFGFEMLAKDIYAPALSSIPIDSSKAGGANNLYSAIKQIFTKRATGILTKDEAIIQGLITGNLTGKEQKGELVTRKNGKLSWQSQGRTIGSTLPAWAKKTSLATLLTTASGVSHALKLLKRNSGGEIGGNIHSGKSYYGIPSLSAETIARLTAKWKPKDRFWPQGHQYILGNQDPLHGPMQIGKSMHLKAHDEKDVFKYLNKPIIFQDKTRMNIMDPFLIGTKEERAKLIVRSYMDGKYSVLKQPGAKEALSAVEKRFTGKLFRGTNLRGASAHLPKEVVSLLESANKTGDYSALLGQEFLMDDASWSAKKSVAERFSNQNPDIASIILEANLRGKKVVPMSEMFPNVGVDKTGQYAGNISEHESFFGGKFKVAGIKENKSTTGGPSQILISLQALVDGAREKGGPVSAGKSYLVGEKGPELFVPKTNGKILPNYETGGDINKKQTPRLDIASTIGSLGGSLGGQMVGQKMFGEIGSLAGMILGGMIPQLLMTSKQVEGVTVKTNILLKAFNFFKNLPGPVRFLAVIVGVGLAIKKVNDMVNEHRRIIDSTFAPEQSTITKLGLQYKTLGEQIDSANKKIVTANASAAAYKYSTSKVAGQGINLTQKELDTLKASTKKDFQTEIKAINMASPEEASKKAEQLKAIFVSSGMAVDKANSLIYALILNSNKAQQAVSILANEGFSKIEDKATAASSTLKTFNDLLKSGNTDQLGKSLNTAINAYQNLEQSLINTTDKTKEIVTASQAYEKVLKQIGKNAFSNKEIGEDGVKSLISQDSNLSGIINKSDTLKSILAKTKLYTAGISTDFEKMNANAAIDLSIVVNKQEEILRSTSGPYAALAKDIAAVSKTNAAQIIKNANASADSIKKEIELHNKNIDKIKSEADARKNALDQQNSDDNINLQIKAKQLEYQQKLAMGDMVGAAQSQIAIQELVGSQQLILAKRAIDTRANKDIAKEQKTIDSLNAKIDGLQTTVNKAQSSADAASKKADNLQGLLDELVLLTEAANQGPLSSLEQDRLAKLKKDLGTKYSKITDKLGASGNKFVSPAPGVSINMGGATSGISDIAKNTLTLAYTESKPLFTSDKITQAKLEQLLKINAPIKITGSYSGGKAGGVSARTVQQIDLQNAGKSYKKGSVVTINGVEYEITSDANSKGSVNIVPTNNKAEGGMIQRYSKAGKVSGPGTGTSDSIPAMLSNGEYVIKADAVSHYSPEFFDSVNAKKFAKGGLLQNWAKSISGMPGAEMFGTASLLRKFAGMGQKGDNLSAAMLPLNFIGMGLGNKLSPLLQTSKMSGMLGKLGYALPNKINQIKNQAKVNAMIKNGMWHGSYENDDGFLTGHNVIEYAATRDPHFGMGFFGTSSKSEAESYAGGLNAFDWGAKGGTLHNVIKAPKGKYVDFTRGTNSIKWQDYGLHKALGIKKNGYLGNYLDENLGKIMDSQKMTGSIMNRLSAGMVPKDMMDAKWLAWNNPAGVHTLEYDSMRNKMKLPKFKNGINSVPVDMLAQLHKNEAVIPANMNPFNPNANNATMGGSYTINVTLNGSNLDANDVANAISTKMKLREAMTGRGRNN